jgi:aminocarboxymuconate-semialdehyde decarboxylase
MMNRRRFVKCLAGAAAGALVGEGTPRRGAAGQPSAAPVRRRDVVVGGRRIKVVDVHAHCVVPAVADLIKGTPLASTVRIPTSGPNVLGPDRIRILDQRGIDVQVLSINGYWWYRADRDLAREIVRVHDEALAAWCAAHPGRFVALTSVALQYPDLAVEQLEYAVTRLGFRGASVGGHVEGEELSSRRFDPFWAKVEQLGVLVFMHPSGAEHVLKPGALDGRGDLGNIIGNPLETTVFLSRLIFDGTFDRFPGLRICAAHGGGYLPSYLGRSEVACTVRPNADCANRKRPSEYLRSQVLVDSMIFSEEGLRHLVAEVGAGQIVYGTDVPFNWPDTLDIVLGAPFLSDADKEAILGGTLVKLLRLSA